MFSIHIPPLRERKEDIPLLAEHFLKYFCRREGKKIEGFGKGVIETFLKYPWYGNVRELKNVIERAVILCDGREIELAHLPEELKNLSWEMGCFSGRKGGQEEEKERILKALEKTKWNKTQAAKLLGLTRNQLRYKLKKLGID